MRRTETTREGELRSWEAQADTYLGVLVNEHEGIWDVVVAKMNDRRADP